ncbi:hypothetical protein SLEP1_g41000 [Rubroshorea leprosula]|uniref:Uncharacterized protein n=1 Tax=Rubroshorea leprosula TaxID=152421 RepID=A0AAV5L594_9ROSI|nr:hypothetical protein SLEP1_g41000 [Rubroshorea leprosula]
MASKGMEASDILKVPEEEQGRQETRGDVRRKRRLRAVSPASKDVMIAFEGRLAKMELAMGDVHEQLNTLDFEEEEWCDDVERLRGKLQGAFNSFIANMSRAVKELQGSLASSGGASVESSPAMEVSHTAKSKPGGAKDMAQISHNLQRRQGSNASKLKESSHTIEPKPEEARDVAQDMGDSWRQQGLWWGKVSRYVSLRAEVKGIMAWSSNHGHTGGVCNVQGACHAAPQSAQGGTLKRQRALPVEASMPRPLHEAVGRTRGSVPEQSGATCVCTRECPSLRHGCTHGQPRSRCSHGGVQSSSRHWRTLERPRASTKRAMPAVEEVSTRKKYTGIWCRHVCGRLERSRTL